MRMIYSGKYKAPGQLFWRKIQDVKGDVIENGVRVIIFTDESQLHLPIDAMVKWDRNRFLFIKKRMNDEAGQELRINEGEQE